MAIPSYNADDYVNDPNLEEAWAAKAFEQAEIHFKILQNNNSRNLRLTKVDDAIYNHFRQTFQDMPVNKIDEDEMKSEAGKKVWREFCEIYKEIVEDYNFASLLRIDSSFPYNEHNTTIAPRIQFLAIEIARNREGHNDSVFVGAPVSKDSGNSA